MILRDQSCEVSTVSTVLEFSSPYAMLLIRYVDRSSNYSIYRNTAYLPAVSIKAISYFIFTHPAPSKTHKPIPVSQTYL
jgi:hypothetical protein